MNIGKSVLIKYDRCLLMLAHYSTKACGKHVKETVVKLGHLNVVDSPGNKVKVGHRVFQEENVSKHGQINKIQLTYTMRSINAINASKCRKS